MSKIYKGTIAINSKLAGFITLEGEEDSKYFVHRTNLNGALDGDSVEFALLKVEADPTKTLKDAAVIKVLSHAKGYYVGCFKSDGEHYKVEVDDKKMYLPVKLEDTTGLTSGTKFLFTVVRFTDTEAICKVAKVIGHINDVGTDILSIVYDNGIDPEFPQETLDEANKVTAQISDKDRKERVDITNLPLVSIDPASSKDFDDAVYCQEINANEYRLVVAIADVGHFVRPNTAIDSEALKRGCSVYLVDRVIPMLPHNLCDEICSFNPNVERMSLTCDMIIDSKGNFKEIKCYPAIIKSHRRFTYDEVNAYFAQTDKLEKDTKEVKDSLDACLKLHNILSEMKFKRGYINLDIPEPLIIVDKNCVPVEITKRETGTGQQMIEDFMVAANEAVTIEAEKNHMPFVYRIHDKPKAERFETFTVEAKKLNFKLPQGEVDLTPKNFAN